jgi:hypothetical protein
MTALPNISSFCLSPAFPRHAFPEYQYMSNDSLSHFDTIFHHLTYVVR